MKEIVKKRTEEYMILFSYMCAKGKFLLWISLHTNTHAHSFTKEATSAIKTIIAKSVDENNYNNSNDVVVIVGEK